MTTSDAPDQGATSGRAPAADTPLPPIVRLTAARKHYGAVRALDGVDLSIAPGECIALVGHNGAGKSTLVHLVNAGIAPSEGAVAWLMPDGSPAPGPHPARAAGVRSVFQELSLCPNLTVAENLRITQRDLTGPGWRGRAAARIGAALAGIFPGHRIAPDMTVGDLTLAERQMVEVAAGFATGDRPARLVILDEPTSSLDAAIAAQLIAHVRAFCAQGGAVIFISHMMGEVFAAASRIAVMKDGRIVADRPAGAFTRQSLVEAMGHVGAAGAAVPAMAAQPRDGTAPAGPEIVTTPEGLRARAGEIVGLAGLAGHGQAETLARFYLAQTSDWRGGRRAPAVFVAGDRGRDGLMPLWSILRNATLARLPALSRRGMIDRAAEVRQGAEWRARVGIRTDDMENPILSLSGGNQQKVLFARALATDAPVVVMDDPMRGVDVGTKAEVHAMIRAEARAGRTFLWYSTELDETRLCDRVFVFRNGRIGAELTGAAITEEAILAASFEMGEVPA